MKLIFRIMFFKISFVFLFWADILPRCALKVSYELNKLNVSLCFSYSTDANTYGSVATVKLTFAENTLRLLIVSFGFEMLENILDLSWI